jgi:hypothetical protein
MSSQRVLGLYAGSDVSFNGQLVALQLDKEPPHYTYEEPALHTTEKAVADSVSTLQLYQSALYAYYDNISLSYA